MPSTPAGVPAPKPPVYVTDPWVFWKDVKYEIEEIAKNAITAVTAVSQGRVDNGAVEGMLLHVRCVADFLEGRGRKPDDIYPEHFEPKGWTRPVKILDQRAAPDEETERERINGEVGHLTYRRKLDTDPKKGWPPEIALRVLKHAQTFFKAVGREPEFPKVATEFWALHNRIVRAQSIDGSAVGPVMMTRGYMPDIPSSARPELNAMFEATRADSTKQAILTTMAPIEVKPSKLKKP